MARVTDIPRAQTPPGGWKGDMPAPILSGCTDPLDPSCADLRGTWRVVDVRVNGEKAHESHPLWNHVERIEQAGRRVVITSGGIIHDFPAVDGTFENGCHDVAAMDYATPIVIAASFEDEVLVLRPQGMPDVEVRRRREADALVWDYVGGASVRMERTGRT